MALLFWWSGEGKTLIAVDSRGVQAVDRDNTLKKGRSASEQTDESSRFWRTE